jgi:hypothetical protein
MRIKLDWQVGEDEDDDLNWRMLKMKAQVDTTPPAGIMFNPINPEVLRLWIKSQSTGKENYIWHYLFGSLIVFGLLATYIFIR